MRLARVSEISFAHSPPKGAVQLLVRGEVVALPLAGVIDLAAEKPARGSAKEMQKGRTPIIARVRGSSTQSEIRGTRAPEEVVEEERKTRAAGSRTRPRSPRRWMRLKGAE